MDLTASVRWAREHDAHARRMVLAANERIRQVVSVRGLYAYSEALVHGYARAFAAAAQSGVQAARERSSRDAARGSFGHEFACSYGAHTTCALTRL